MEMGEIGIWLLLALAIASFALLLRQNGASERLRREFLEKERTARERERALREELAETVQRSIRSLGEMLGETARAQGKSQEDKLVEMQRGLAQMSIQLETRLKTSELASEQKLDNIRVTMEQKLGGMQQDNNKKLDEMRLIVDEKLQRTLNDRMSQSFKLVNDRLEQVYKGLGEMQTLAVGVGDLKKVLSNVKTRGTLGEIQLEAILSEILSPEQYEKNVAPTRQGRDRVEFAIKLPADGDGRVLMPIDSKFPMDAYSELMDAYEGGDAERVHAAQETLKTRLRSFAKDIHDKYIDPPATTEFGIMFLPTEGLYAEAVKLGLVERLQHEYRVSIAGPSTMAALLNSLQMGFRSVAIQKRSGEVWKVLSAVKTEFERFHDVLARTQKQLTSANDELDKLVGVRTRQIRSRLKDVMSLPTNEAALYLPPEAVEAAGEEEYTEEE
jgi:DNA recombination protein RmuC